MEGRWASLALDAYKKGFLDFKEPFHIKPNYNILKETILFDSMEKDIEKEIVNELKYGAQLDTVLKDKMPWINLEPTKSDKFSTKQSLNDYYMKHLDKKNQKIT